MTPNTKGFEDFLLGCYIGLGVGILLLWLATLSGCVLDTTGKDAGDEAAIHASQAPIGCWDGSAS